MTEVLEIVAAKRCPRCGKDKPLSQFHKSKSQKDGLNVYCKPCWNAYCKARWESDAKNPERLRVRRSGHLRTKYGITIEQYEEILATQEGRCKLCRCLPEEGAAVVGRLGPMLLVDHDHGCCPGAKTCGKCFRGLVCDQCNRALGFVDRVGMKALASYFTPETVPPSSPWTPWVRY